MSARTNAQPWLGIRLLLTNDLDLIAEVSGPYILIRAPKGSFKATYKNSPDSRQLVLESEWFSNGREKPIRLAHFRARAWRLANDTATELGWF